MPVRFVHPCPFRFLQVRQYGFPELSCESLWATICTLRSSGEKQIPGGMSEVMKLVLKQFFGRPSGPDLRGGVLLNLQGDGGPRLVHGELSMLLADERGHTFALQCKGGQGHKTCLFCKNVLNKNSSWLPDPSGHCIPAAVTDVS
eukprot:9299956-Pyramimonas_sp.AAC.1